MKEIINYTETDSEKLLAWETHSLSHNGTDTRFLIYKWVHLPFSIPAEHLSALLVAVPAV